jgi:hypothetical protein
VGLSLEGNDMADLNRIVQSIRASADFRGTFVQGQKVVLFLMVTDLDGNARDADTISYTITDPSSSVVQSGSPEKCANGFYAVDWNIAQEQTVGDYEVFWTFTVNGESGTEVQEVVVDPLVPAQDYRPNLYSGRVLDFRMQLNFLLRSAQNIPVYNEPAKQTTDYKTYRFTFPRWNQSAGVRIMRNNVPVTSGLSINYFKGEVTFDTALTSYDRVNAYYNFRWFSDEELDRFMSNALHVVNYYPHPTTYSFLDLDDRYVPLVLWGAAVEALRHLMLDITFQEPALVFGDRDGVDRAHARFETLKKNYEEYWDKGLDQKKNRNYVGLTRGIVTPEYSLPGGRSRWFRYLFTSS